MTSAIPYDEIDALLLDAGNTLISMDTEWIRSELGECGVRATAQQIERAEAAARPEVSGRIAGGTSTEGIDNFTFYVGAMLRGLREAIGDFDVEDACAQIVPALRAHGTGRLWSRVLPGIPEALGALRSGGVELVVCSNSDGTAQATLNQLGLLPLLDGVIDSHVVGFEKPHAGIFEAALGLTGASQERALHVGDIYAADVVGARGAGIHVVLLDPFDDWDGVDCERAPDVPTLARRILEARG